MVMQNKNNEIFSCNYGQTTFNISLLGEDQTPVLKIDFKEPVEANKWLDFWMVRLDVNDLLRREYSRDDTDNVSKNLIYHFTVKFEGTSSLVINGNLHQFLSLPPGLNCVDQAVLKLLNNSEEEAPVYEVIQSSKIYRLPEEQFTDEDYEWTEASDDEEEATVYCYEDSSSEEEGYKPS